MSGDIVMNKLIKNELEIYSNKNSENNYYVKLNTNYSKEIKSKNHNDLSMAIDIHYRVAPKITYLTHISHQLDEWFEKTGTKCPEGVVVAYDGLRIELTK